MEVVLDKFEAFVGVNFFTMIFAWINLVILYVFLKKLLFKPVKNMIDSRQKEIDEEIGCRFIRVSDEETHFYNVGYVIKEIFKIN